LHLFQPINYMLHLNYMISLEANLVLVKFDVPTQHSICQTHFEPCQCCQHKQVNTLLLIYRCIILCAYAICLLQQAVQKMHNKTSHYSNANFVHYCLLVLVASQENGQCTVMCCTWHFGQRWTAYMIVVP
jgi:hypothetical protein